jgi:hypothetical protein
MTTSQRTLLVAVVTAAVLGFAGGWFAHHWSEPTIEDRANDAVKGARERLREFAR